MTIMIREARGTSGSATSELPVALLVFLLVALFPLIDMATLFMGSNSVVGCARAAVVAAARAQTFTTDASPEQPSAINIARRVANSYTTGGVTITDVKVTVTALPIQGGDPVQITPSPSLAVNPSANIYQINVTVTGSVTPIVILSGEIFGKVPGLTAPMIVTSSSSANFENTAGLTK